MTERKWKRIDNRIVDREITPFKLLDRWGRWVGYEIVVHEIFYEEAPEAAAIYYTENKAFAAFTYDTRDERHYPPLSDLGASTAVIFGDSQDEVMEKARKRRDGARKRQVKQWGGLAVNKEGGTTTMTKQMMTLSAAIADRAVKLYADQGVKVKRLDVMMDLEYCHENAQALDFEKLHGFDDSNLAHDVGGIRRHFNRETFELEDCFLPRCSMPAGKTI